jgi:predicted nuclease of predicted toxin-antitoxin system
MTFLLDHDVPEDITYSLQTLGHRLIRLRDVLPKEAGDEQVLAHASQAKAVLITCNRDDFLELAKSESHCGIIILIRRRTRVAERAALVRLLDEAGESGITHNINFA